MTKTSKLINYIRSRADISHGLIFSCRQHPRYRGKGVPRLSCPVCWAIYMEGEYGAEPDTALVLARFKEAVIRTYKIGHSNEQAIRNTV